MVRYLLYLKQLNKVIVRRISSVESSDFRELVVGENKQSVSIWIYLL